MGSYSFREPKLISAYAVRQAIGWLGVFLPAFMIIGNSLFQECDIIRSSISHYYYTITGYWFVGILFAVAMFLISYKGYDRRDVIASSVAGFSAVLIALFPTNIESLVPAAMDIDSCALFSLPENKIRNAIHYGSAALFFITLAYMSLFLFTESRGEKSPKKIIRNKIFRTCGIIIFIAIVLIALYGIFEERLPNLGDYKPVFWLEWIALMAFGISWLIKGEVVLKDSNLKSNKTNN